MTQELYSNYRKAELSSCELGYYCDETKAVELMLTHGPCLYLEGLTIGLSRWPPTVLSAPEIVRPILLSGGCCKPRGKTALDKRHAWLEHLH